MNIINTWNPFRELEALQNRYLQALHLNRPEGDGSQSLTASDWTPSVDITEDANGYQIKAELPEVNKEDVHITLENGVLTIRGERRIEKEESDRKHIRIERSYGSFVRSFSIPEDAEEGQVTADYKDGVLNIHLPKSEAKKPKRIEVSVS